MSPLGVVLVVAGAVLVALAGLVATVVLGLRHGNRRIIDAVRRFHRTVTNRLQLRVAGRPGATMSLIRHRGRVTGTEFVTPIGPSPEGDGYVIALPYGRSADWLRNLQAAGTATLVIDGGRVEIADPRIVPIADTRLAADPMVRFFGVREAVRVRRR